MENGDKVLFVYDYYNNLLQTLDGMWAVTGVRAVKSDGASLSQPQHLSVLNEMAEETKKLIDGYEQGLELLNKSNIRLVRESDEEFEKLSDLESKIDGFRALESDLKEDIAYLKEKNEGYRKEFNRLNAENKLLISIINEAIKS